MPSQSRALEASFEPSGKSPVPPGSGATPALEDFDSFFEKLNHPDPVGWGSAHPANPERKAPAGAAGNKPAGAAKQPSAKADALAGLRAAVAQAKQSQPRETAQASGHEPPPKQRRGISGAFRFAATAFVLFIVGMGIGWAALSLPGKMSSDTATTVSVPPPGAATVAERPRNAQTADALVAEPKAALPKQSVQDASSDRMASMVPLTEVTPGPDSRDTALLKPEGSESPSPSTAAKSSGSAAVDAPAAPPERLSNAQTAQIEQGNRTEALGSDGRTAHPSSKIAVSAQSGKTPDAPAKHPARPAAARKPAPQATPAVAAAAAEASPAPEPAKDASAASSQTATGPRYAVQVGACRSARCIENYRALVATHLPANADNIRVIPVPAHPSGVQRIRVAPLGQSEAQRLRMALVQADPRLSNAYVVVVHP